MTESNIHKIVKNGQELRLTLFDIDGPSYQSKWQQIRQQVLERDKYECQKCRLNFPKLDIHHISQESPYPGYMFNTLDNLVTLCRKCHKIVESEKYRLDRYLWHLRKRS